jgi:hypothetical protein
MGTDPEKLFRDQPSIGIAGIWGQGKIGDLQNRGKIYLLLYLKSVTFKAVLFLIMK